MIYLSKALLDLFYNSLLSSKKWKYFETLECFYMNFQVIAISLLILLEILLNIRQLNKFT
jgi:hypothetical protein